MTRRLQVAAHTCNAPSLNIYDQDKNIIDGSFIELYIHNPLHNY